MSDDLAILVKKHSLRPSLVITDKTRLGEDLHIIGDDAEELLSEFSSHFDIDLSNFDFDNYFPREASSEMHYYSSAIAEYKYGFFPLNLYRFINSFFWGMFSQRKEFKTITVGDLRNMINHSETRV